MNDRFENINLLRAFAATAIVVYHVIEYANWSSFPTGGPLLTFSIGWIGVDLFFVISGFVITRSALALWRKDPAAFAGRYWARRAARIVPLYMLTCTLWVVLFKRNWFDHDTTHLLWQIASHMTFTHSFWPVTYSSIDGVNWTLALEMQFLAHLGRVHPDRLGVARHNGLVLRPLRASVVVHARDAVAGCARRVRRGNIPREAP